MKNKIKYFNKSKRGEYTEIPFLSPYSKISKKRISNTKFTYRKTNQYVLDVLKNPRKWLDIGCANGEFIYYLADLWRETKFTGIDIVNEYIKVARKLNKRYDNAKFHCKNVFDVSNDIHKSEVVTCLGTFHIFPQPEDLLNTLLDLVDKGGLLVINGRFNPYDVSAIIKFKDDSNKITKNVWRCDFNLHSESWIKEMLSKRSDIDNFDFFYPVMDTKIPKKKNAPHINMWTVPRKNGGYDIENGLRVFCNPAFLVIKKK